MVLSLKKGVGALFAILLAFAFMMGAASSALAGPTVEPGEPAEGAELGNIDFEAPRSLTIHKFANPTFDDPGVPGDGNEITNTPADRALSGVEFKIAKITDIDLTDSTQWAQIADLAPAADGTVAGHTLGAWTSQETVDGVTTFANIEAGVYVVMEGADNGDNNITRATAPFIVTVPFPNEDKWVYDVHAYPKNSVTEVTKTVEDEVNVGGADGEVVTWVVDVKVPNEAEPLNSFVVSDTFDPRLSYASDVAASVVGDFATPADYTIEVSGQTVKVVFTTDGLLKLDGMKGETVSVRFPTRVISPGSDGIIPNTATVYVNDPDESNGHDSNPTDTPWGEVAIFKMDSDPETGKVLANAEFSIYLSAEDAAAGTNAIATIVTDDEGFASQVLAEGTYYIKETKAPAGYVLSDEVHEVVINTKAENGPVTVSVDLDIPNVKSDVPDLPITGAAGRVILTVGGGALLLLAVGTGLLAYKRRRS